MDSSFYFLDGDNVSSVRDLALKIDSMSTDTFSHHVTTEKNDFASWVDSCGMSDLASTISTIKDKKDMAYEVMKFALRN